MSEYLHEIVKKSDGYKKNKTTPGYFQTKQKQFCGTVLTPFWPETRANCKQFAQLAKQMDREASEIYGKCEWKWKKGNS